LLDAGVDPAQHGGGGDEFERAAHGETLFRAMRERAAASRIEHGDP
jgi:hypothetical protein